MLTGDPGDEHQRIDNAIDVDLPRRAERDAFCEVCGATPGSPCVSTGPGQPIKTTPHEKRIMAYWNSIGPAAGSPPIVAPTASEVALKGLQASVREQLLAFCAEPITAKTLSRIQRFCSSMGQAMLGLEKPEALIRDRFGPVVGLNPGYNITDAGYDLPPIELPTLSPAPVNETYGANASRGLIAEAAKIGKDIIEAQAKAQAEARRPFPPSMPELVHALVEAKKQKLPKAVLQALEKQITDLSAPAEEVSQGGA